MTRPATDRIALASIAVLLGLLLHSAWRVGPTVDEHFYVASGASYWHTGDLSLNREHPPLLKLLAGLPLVLLPDVDFPADPARIHDFPSAFFFQRNAEHLDRNLFAARVPLCLLTALGAWLVYRTARACFGGGPALVSLALFAFGPNVLAHGPLATLDAGLAVLLFAAVVALADLAARPDARRALVAGLASGLAALAKFTALVLGPLGLALAVAASLRARSARPLAAFAAAGLAALGVFAAGYGFEARSLASVWAHPAYAVPAPREETAAIEPIPLAAIGRRGGLSDASVARVRGAPDARAAIESLAAIAGGSDERQALAALDALATVAEGEEALRKLGFARLLETEPAAPAVRARRGEVLAALAGVELSGGAAWRAWHEACAGIDWDREVLTRPWLRAGVRALFGDGRPVPLLTAIKGIDFQLARAGEGHRSYFRGEVLTEDDFEHGNPHPEYYLVVLGVKCPIAFLVLAAAGLALSAVAAVRAARGASAGFCGWREVAMAGAPIVLLALFSGGSALLGVKYVLPVLPFLCVLAARFARRWPRAGAALAVVAVAESIWIHPHELMYYNALAGGPEGGPRITVVGDDWGQGVRELGRFHRENREWIEAAGGLRFNPYTTGDLAAFGLEDTLRWERIPRGIVAVHLSELLRDPLRHAPLEPYEPFARIDRSILLFDTREPPPGGDPLAGRGED